jgi:hypothetical protein
MLLKNSAGRRCDQKALQQRFPARNPTAYTPCGVCCERSTVFQQPEPN